MPKFNNFVGILAISAALTSGAIALGTTVTSASADAVAHLGGYIPPAPYIGPGNYNSNRNRQGQKSKAKNHNKNKNKNKHKQWQHERQHQAQHQFLLRDFTLVLTPFQKTDTDARALPYNWQYGYSQSLPWTYQYGYSDQQNLPYDRQQNLVDPQQRVNSNVRPRQEGLAEADPRIRSRNELEPRRVVIATPTPTVTVTAAAAAAALTPDLTP